MLDIQTGFILNLLSKLTQDRSGLDDRRHEIDWKIERFEQSDIPLARLCVQQLRSGCDRVF